MSRLLFVVASHLDGRSRVEEIAARVSEEYGRTLDAEGVQFLVTAKLRPMGIAAEAVPPEPRLVRAPRRERPGDQPARTARPDAASRSHPPAREPVAGATVPRHALPASAHPVPRAPARATVLRPRRRARVSLAARRRGRLAAAAGQPGRRRRLDPRRPADAALGRRDPVGRHGDPRARPRGRLPLRRRATRARSASRSTSSTPPSSPTSRSPTASAARAGSAPTSAASTSTPSPSPG